MIFMILFSCCVITYVERLAPRVYPPRRDVAIAALRSTPRRVIDAVSRTMPAVTRDND